MVTNSSHYPDGDMKDATDDVTTPDTTDTETADRYTEGEAGLAKMIREISITEISIRSPSMIQSKLGNRGNFELVVPSAALGLDYYWRNNDDWNLPWYGPFHFADDARRMSAASLIHSNFGDPCNLEVASVDYDGMNLFHLWRDSGPDFEWHEARYISEPSSTRQFLGNPSMIQSTYGQKGNFDLVVPLAEGGLAHYWRDNDDPDLPWYGPFNFGSPSGALYSSVCLIQSNFGDRGNLEVVARSEDILVHFWRDSGPEFRWNGPFPIATGVSGTPSFIQGRYGNKGNFELLSPLAAGGLGHFWRDNDDSCLPWHGPLIFGTRLGLFDSVSMIQSNFGDPGSLEAVAVTGGDLAFFWREPGAEPRWKGPQFIASL